MVFDKFSRHDVSLRSSAQYRDCSSTRLTVQGLLIYTSHSTGTAHLHVSQYRDCSSTHQAVLKLRRIDFIHSHRRAVRRSLYSLDPLNNEPLSSQRFPTRQTIDCGQDRCQPLTVGRKVTAALKQHPFSPPTKSRDAVFCGLVSTSVRPEEKKKALGL